MQYRLLASMKVAVIGDSELNQTLSAALTNAGHLVANATLHSPSSGRKRSSSGSDTIAPAANWSDLIMITAPSAQVREIAYSLDDVRQKVIIDLSTNVCEKEVNSNTTAAIASITNSPHVIKALSIQGFEKLFSPLFGGEYFQMLLAGNSVKAKAVATIMMQECGITRVHDFGNSDHYPLLDELAKCYRGMVNRQG